MDDYGVTQRIKPMKPIAQGNTIKDFSLETGNWIVIIIIQGFAGKCSLKRSKKYKNNLFYAFWEPKTK